MDAEFANGLHAERPQDEASQMTGLFGGLAEPQNEPFDHKEIETVLLGVIGLIDRFEIQIDDMARQACGHPERAHTWKEQIAWRRGDVLELDALLRGQGVTGFRVVGDRFRIRYQNCVDRIPTADADAAGKVVKRLRKGYRRGERVIRRELVAVSVAVPLQTSGKGNE